MTLDIPRKEVYRYLGFRGITPDDAIKERVEVCCGKILKAASPRWVYKDFPLEFPRENVLCCAGMEVHSRALCKNMEGCTRAVLMAVTAGQGVDLLIRRSEVTSMTDAAICQAAGAACVEEVCDRVNEEIRKKAEKEGFETRPRFSPGYGDFSLEHQKDFFRILDITKTIAVSLSDTLLMTPSKSVTAMIGLAPAGAVHSVSPLSGCESCQAAASCQFRKDTEKGKT